MPSIQSHRNLIDAALQLKTFAEQSLKLAYDISNLSTQNAYLYSTMRDMFPYAHLGFIIGEDAKYSPGKVKTAKDNAERMKRIRQNKGRKITDPNANLKLVKDFYANAVAEYESVPVYLEKDGPQVLEKPIDYSQYKDGVRIDLTTPNLIPKPGEKLFGGS
jgi:hypothetical protein